MSSFSPKVSRQYRNTRAGSGDLSSFAMVWLVVLLVFPSLAVLRIGRSFDVLRYEGGYVAIIWIVTWLLYRHDKRQAQSGGWRTPESTLHIAELLGGWPAAFLAQRVYRHKISKTRYQIMFWFIVILHEYTALDFMLGWHYSRDFLKLFR